MAKANTTPGTLLACQWRDVVALNFEADERALAPYLPPGTRVARYNNHTMLTLMAKNARELQPWGGSLTLFRSVGSIDIRCYVQCETNSGITVGHVVLRRMLSNKWCARLLRALYRTTCDVEKITHEAKNFETAQRDALPSAEYRWTTGGESNQFVVRARAAGRKPADQSREDFVLHQRYRFAASPSGTRVSNIRQTPWVVWNASSGSYDCAETRWLGPGLSRYFRKPMSVMMSSGGEVKIHRPRALADFQANPS